MRWDFVIGLLAISVAIGATAAGAQSFRRRHLPAWTGAPGMLASTILTMGAVTFVIQILGAIGLFSAVPIAIVLTGLGGGVWWLLRAEPTEPMDPAEPDRRLGGLLSRFPGMALLLGGGLVTAAWMARSARGLSILMDVETIRYRLPISARFVQEAQMSSIHMIDTISGTLIAYYPHLSEAHHAVGMAFLGSELAMAVINPALVALTLLGAWCIGRPFGVGAVSALGALTVPATPMITHLHAGNATNDVMVMAMLVSAAAILVSADRRPTPDPRIPIAIAGLAAGMGIATKYTLLPVFIALTVLVVAKAASGGRLSAFLVWTVASLSVSWLWFVRNLVAVGNPVPPIEAKIGPIGFPAVPDPYQTESLTAHLLDARAWSDHLLPGLRLAWGPAIWPILILTVIVLPAVIIWGPTTLTKGLGIIAAVSLASYLILPQPLGTRLGQLDLFRYNVRYMAHGAALSFALIPTVPKLAGRLRYLLAAGFLVVLAWTQLDATFWAFTWVAPGYADPVTGGFAQVGLIFGLAVAAFGIVWLWRPYLVRRAQTPVSLGVIAIVLLTAVVATDSYRREKGQNISVAASYPAAAWAWDAPDGTRIGFTGLPISWHLYGKDMTNHVTYLGRTLDDGSFVGLETCQAYRAAVNEGDFTHIVTIPENLMALDSPQKAWTESDPAAVAVDGVRDGTVFELRGSLDPGSCPPA